MSLRTLNKFLSIFGLMFVVVIEGDEVADLRVYLVRKMRWLQRMAS
jgi:hypothetical protein